MAVLEAHRVSILEIVVDQLRAVRRSELDTLFPPGDSVAGKGVVLWPSRIDYPRSIEPQVGENVVPEGKK